MLLELHMDGCGLQVRDRRAYHPSRHTPSHTPCHALTTPTPFSHALTTPLPQGPIPQLHLPALRILYTSDNELTGGLEPLRDCISLEEIGMDGNHLTGTHVK